MTYHLNKVSPALVTLVSPKWGTGAALESPTVGVCQSREECPSGSTLRAIGRPSASYLLRARHARHIAVPSVEPEPPPSPAHPPEPILTDRFGEVRRGPEGS